MIIAFANKKLEVTNTEKKYLNTLEKTFGKDIFIGLFDTNKNGLITSITPSPKKPTQIVILFFLLNLMLNQRLRKIDISRIEKLENRIKELEDIIKEERQ